VVHLVRARRAVPEDPPIEASPEPTPPPPPAVLEGSVVEELD
jgi:hypothetical protein